MTDKITEPVPPSDLDPMPPPVLAGDWTDDDGSLVDAEFEAADHGPVKHTGVPHAVPEIKPATRLLNRSCQVGTVSGALTDPIMLMPADSNRKSLSIVASGAAGLSWTFADTKSDCYNGITFYTFAVGFPTVIKLDGHTGALWVHSTANNVISVAASAVTA